MFKVLVILLSAGLASCANNAEAPYVHKPGKTQLASEQNADRGNIPEAILPLLRQKKRDRCIPLNNWLDDLKTLYGYDFTKQGHTRTHLIKKVSPGFADDVFEKWIGKPFGKLSKKDRKTIGKSIQQCHAGAYWGIKFILEPFTSKRGQAGYDEWMRTISTVGSGRTKITEIENRNKRAKSYRERVYAAQELKRSTPRRVVLHAQGKLVYQDAQVSLFTFHPNTHYFENRICPDVTRSHFSLVVKQPRSDVFRLTRQSVSSLLSPALMQALKTYCPALTDGVFKIFLQDLYLGDNAKEYTRISFPRGEYHELPFGYVIIRINKSDKFMIQSVSGFSGTTWDPDENPEDQTVAGLRALRDRNWIRKSQFTAMQQQRYKDRLWKQDSPFSDVKAGAYFHSIYSGDFVRARRMDKVFARPYKNDLTAQGISLVAPLMNAITESAGIRKDFNAEYQNAIDSTKMVRFSLAVYLLSYQDVYGACLKRDAVTFKKTSSSATIYRDAWGNELNRVEHSDKVSYFRVNRKFRAVFEELGLSNPDSALSHIYDKWLRVEGEVSLRDIVTGTKQIMKNNACNSPLIEKLERQMLAYYGKS